MIRLHSLNWQGEDQVEVVEVASQVPNHCSTESCFSSGSLPVKYLHYYH